MKSLNNILKFIDLKDISIRSFEKEAGISNGTINKCIDRNADLSEENIDRIVEKYSTELAEKGFYLVDMTEFGGGKSIINQEEKKHSKATIGRFGIGIETMMVMEPAVPYGKDKSESSAFIEVKTTSGKEIRIKPENNNEVALLNAFYEEKEERHKDAELRAEQAEKEKDRLYSLFEKNLTALLKITGQIDANSKAIADDLTALITEIQAENRAIMDSIDVAAKQPIGTTRAKAGTVEIASHEEHEKKDKKVSSGK